jgi:hypothetical protein
MSFSERIAAEQLKWYEISINALSGHDSGNANEAS